MIRRDEGGRIAATLFMPVHRSTTAHPDHVLLPDPAALRSYPRAGAAARQKRRRVDPHGLNRPPPGKFQISSFLKFQFSSDSAARYRARR